MLSAKQNSFLSSGEENKATRLCSQNTNKNILYYLGNPVRLLITYLNVPSFEII